MATAEHRLHQQPEARDRPSLLKRNLLLVLSYIAIMAMVATAYAS